MDLWNNLRGNSEYFVLMRDWHREHSGCAVEELTKEFIMRNARNNVLDAGCGEGTVMKYFAGRVRNASFYGVDISPLGVEMAKENNLPNCNFLTACLEELPFPNSFFSLIYSQSVLEHVRNLDKVLEEFHRTLDVNGKLIIRVGNGGIRNTNFLAAVLKYLFKRNRIECLTPSCEIRRGHEFEDHMSNFDAQEIPSDILLRKLEEVGFETLYFSTRPEDETDTIKRRNLKRYVRNLFEKLPFFPFTHLGATTFVMAMKKTKGNT